VDIEEHEETLDYGLKCRIYLDTGSGISSYKTFRMALERAKKGGIKKRHSFWSAVSCFDS
jgi:hypothetical protein